MDKSYDLVVIGAGPAGEVAAELASAFGRAVLVVERSTPGGVVTTTGGAPTKALREAALYLTGYRQEEVYGVRAAAPLQAVMPTLGVRIEQVRDVLQDAVARRFVARGITYLQGVARIDTDRTVHITSPDGTAHAVASRAVVIATGSRPTHYSGIPFDDPDVYDSDEIWALPAAPTDIVIVGGGPIGVEFATVFTALGIPATLVNKSDRLLPTVDGELAGLLAEEFQRRGVRLVLGAGADGVRRVDGRLLVTLSNGTALEGDAVLFAAGRTANTEALGLEQAGVRLDAAGRIIVDRYYRTTAPGIYAAGDVVRPGLASSAMQQGRAAAAHACGLVFGVEIDQTVSTAVYGLPEVASAGATEEQIRSSGIPYAVGRCDLSTTPRGAIAGHGGLLKLIFHADNRKLLGVHCFGDIASEVVGLGHVVLQLGGRIEMFLTLALNTPTYNYAYHDATVDGLTRLTKLMGMPESGESPVQRSRAS
ncbi:FAD-dependent oxidoreductase [Georgenia ruanii]|uniref:NAD(P)(+) transhydrogenase (Si-specific) n=1 Tax=Georgenia ruanii TaxID=348442 RepID=A0A7J9V0X5_9MICO|nr:FAD-dependent oxidoreductase [Georgenia ruanii]MPV90263.1 pyridine nucleotide-disulfide oxidoreductase [Georgenia ruanii]